MSLFSGPLRRRELRLLVAGSAVSLVGDGIYGVAMAVAVLHIGGSAGSLAALAVANLVPRVAFGLLGGVLADRFSRRGLVAGCDLVRLVVVATLGLLLLLGSPPMWALLLLVAPLGAASGAAAPAFSALVPGPGARGRAGRRERAARQRQPDGADGGRAGARRPAGGVRRGAGAARRRGDVRGVGAAACCCCGRSPSTRAGRGRCRGRTSGRGWRTSGARRGWRPTCWPGW